jgi:hypothetical protein
MIPNCLTTGHLGDKHTDIIVQHVAFNAKWLFISYIVATVLLLCKSMSIDHGTEDILHHNVQCAIIHDLNKCHVMNCARVWFDMHTNFL